MPLRLITILALLAALATSASQGAQVQAEQPLPTPQMPGLEGSVTAKLRRDADFFAARIATDRFDWISRNSLGATLYSLARVTGDETLYEQAAHALQDSLLQRPRHNPDALAYLALVTMASHSFVEARKLANIGLAEEPDHPWLLAVRGDAYFGHGDYELAQADYQRVHALKPGFSTTARLAAVAFVFNRAQESLQLFEEAAEDAADAGGEQAAWARMMVGMQHLKRHEWRLARHHFILGLRIAPDYRPLMGLLARCLEQDGQDALARPYLQTAIASRPDARLQVRLAALEDRAGNTALASQLRADVQKRLAAAVAQRRGTGDRRILAESLMDAGIEPQAALALAQQDLENRRDLEALRVLCRALRANDAASEALPYAREMLRFGTPDAELQAEAEAVFEAAGVRTDS